MFIINYVYILRRLYSYVELGSLVDMKEAIVIDIFKRYKKTCH